MLSSSFAVLNASTALLLMLLPPSSSCQTITSFSSTTSVPLPVTSLQRFLQRLDATVAVLRKRILRQQRKRCRCMCCCRGGGGGGWRRMILISSSRGTASTTTTTDTDATLAITTTTPDVSSSSSNNRSNNNSELTSSSGSSRFSHMHQQRQSVLLLLSLVIIAAVHGMGTTYSYHMLTTTAGTMTTTETSRAMTSSASTTTASTGASSKTAMQGAGQRNEGHAGQPTRSTLVDPLTSSTISSWWERLWLRLRLLPIQRESIYSWLLSSLWSSYDPDTTTHADYNNNNNTTTTTTTSTTTTTKSSTNHMTVQRRIHIRRGVVLALLADKATKTTDAAVAEVGGGHEDPANTKKHLEKEGEEDNDETNRRWMLQHHPQLLQALQQQLQQHQFEQRASQQRQQQQQQQVQQQQQQEPDDVSASDSAALVRDDIPQQQQHDGISHVVSNPAPELRFETKDELHAVLADQDEDDDRGEHDQAHQHQNQNEFLVQMSSPSIQELKQHIEVADAADAMNTAAAVVDATTTHQKQQQRRKTTLRFRAAGATPIGAAAVEQQQLLLLQQQHPHLFQALQEEIIQRRQRHRREGQQTQQQDQQEQPQQSKGRQQHYEQESDQEPVEPHPDVGDKNQQPDSDHDELVAHLEQEQEQQQQQTLLQQQQQQHGPERDEDEPQPDRELEDEQEQQRQQQELQPELPLNVDAAQYNKLGGNPAAISININTTITTSSTNSSSSTRADVNISNSHNTNPMSSLPSSPPLPPPVTLLREYQQQHSAAVLRVERHENPASLQQRQYVVAPFQCPYQAGMLSLPYLNAVVTALATNRTVLFHYVGHNGNERSECEAVLQFANWMPTYAEFYPEIVGDWQQEQAQDQQKQTDNLGDSSSSNKKSNIVVLNPKWVAPKGVETPNFREIDWIPEALQFMNYLTCQKFIPAYAERGNQVLLEDQWAFDLNTRRSNNNDTDLHYEDMLAHARVIRVDRVYSNSNPFLFWMDWRRPCTSMMQTRALLMSSRYQHHSKQQQDVDSIVPFHRQDRIQQMYEQGVGFLYGMIYRESFEWTHDLLNSIDETDWVASPPKQYFSVGMHSRHPHEQLIGDSIEQEQACLDYLLQTHNTQHLPCRVYLMSDRNVTLQSVGSYAQQKYNCDVVYTHNAAIHNSTRANTEHGPTAGIGYFQDLLVVGTQARSAYMSQFRSSSLLPYAVMEYYRRMEYWQYHHDDAGTALLPPLHDMPLCRLDRDRTIPVL